jgi:enoyl-CoA hydratase/carnithine racemase
MKTDFKSVKVEIQNAVAVLYMNNPPVNQLSQNFKRELIEAVSSGLQAPDKIS